MFRCTVLTGLLVVAGSFVVADEEASSTVAPDLKELIRQLDADEFAVRNAASEKLAKLGKDALPALEEGVRSDSREASTRSFELLQQLLEKGDADAKNAARSSLAKLAQGSDAVATQAKKLLEPKPIAPDVNVDSRTGAIRILGGGGMIRIRAPIAPAAPIRVVEGEARVAKSVSVSVVNGVKTIAVDDNGKKLKIVDDPVKGIEGEITQTKDGKEATSKFAAKDADELKTKHPEAHKLYEQYAKGAGAVRVEFDAIKAKAIAGGRVVRGLDKDRIEALLKKVDEQIETSKLEKGATLEEQLLLDRRMATYQRLREGYQGMLKSLEEAEKKTDAAPKADEPKEDKK
jgi:hypothetical protein